MVSSGPAFGVSGGGSGSGGGGSFIGRVFSVGRFQVTVEEVVAEGKLLNLYHLLTKSFVQNTIKMHSNNYTSFLNLGGPAIA